VVLVMYDVKKEFKGCPEYHWITREILRREN
jgi:hypothetical protein